MHEKIIACASAGVLLAALCTQCQAQTQDTSTVTGVHFGMASNCFSILLSNGHTYALSFGNNNITPDLNVAMTSTLGGAKGELWTLNVGAGPSVTCAQPGSNGANTGPWPPLIGATSVQQ
jgi:hypothetical protein